MNYGGGFTKSARSATIHYEGLGMIKSFVVLALLIHAAVENGVADVA
jgi:hypothetical protein